MRFILRFSNDPMSHRIFILCWLIGFLLSFTLKAQSLGATKVMPNRVSTPHFEFNARYSPNNQAFYFSRVANQKDNIYYTTRRPGSGRFYISFRQPDGQWSKAVNLGEQVNSDTYDFCPSLSPDGKYFFYSSRGDVYQTKIESLQLLIERLRKISVRESK